MGTAITTLLITEKTTIQQLSGKILAVDSYNLLYQFLSTIRQRDGAPLKDSKGNITSHLTGLFFRTTKLMQQGLKMVFVFDGEVPKLKEAERERRKELKIEAQKEYEKAAAKEDIEEMKKYASRTSRLTPEMVEQAKKLIDILGLPIVQAPSEGEAQAAHMAKKGEVYAVVSQDTDSLLFGAPKVVKNLTISGKRKSHGKLAYETTQPEIITLSQNLNHLGVDQTQLIALGMLVGTDYNIGGIRGIGPKKGIELVKKYKDDLDALFEEVEWGKYFDYPWQDIYYLIKKMKITDEYSIKFKNIKPEKIEEFLVKKHDFSKERVKSVIDKFEEQGDEKQKGLGEFF
ncbi:flap endonuclease-1 [Candidatus Woesearchaeota archaeon]|nr:flap endonuclease-1 [Candidatus Woesearchaeota archaeon]